MIHGIHHFHIAHNTLCLPPPKILHKHCFQFLLGRLYVPRETENNADEKFLGGKQSVLWVCGSGQSEVAKSKFQLNLTRTPNKKLIKSINSIITILNCQSAKLLSF